MKEKIGGILLATVENLKESGKLKYPEEVEIQVEIPKRPEHGDYATNLALLLAGGEEKSPRDVAKLIVKSLVDPSDLIEDAEIAGPGFINFKVFSKAWHQAIRDEIVANSTSYGQCQAGGRRGVLVEFVSANPTGPLHIGHGRGAVIGDVIANLLESVGYKVEREYYINDAGTQIQTLGQSLQIRYLQACGKNVELPDTCYRGQYLVELAKNLKGEVGERYIQGDEADIDFFSKYGNDKIIGGIREDLENFRIKFNKWFFETTLYGDPNRVDEVTDLLKETGYLYKADGALWFRSTEFGDEKDRVLVRESGQPTYFAGDLAYHLDKMERGYDKMINVWGADHHGYISRVKAGISALQKSHSGHLNRDSKLEVVLVQLVNLLEAGKQISMSTRAGQFETLASVIEEVGVDAARYLFLMRSSDSPLDFDLEIAKHKSADNPVYYVQYAHARICSIFKNAKELGLEMDDNNLQLLNLPEEHNLIRNLLDYPAIVLESAEHLEPHRLTFYLNDLAKDFHNYYYHHRVVSDNRELSGARLYLMRCMQIVLQNALKILNVTAPEKM